MNRNEERWDQCYWNRVGRDQKTMEWAARNPVCDAPRFCRQR